jgi:GMP synthase-like glutamine amidotransferase
MSKVLILQNAPLFTAGSFEDELKRKEIAYEYVKVFEGGKLPGPDQLKSYSGAIVLGGPLSLRVDHPEKVEWQLRELSWLRTCLERHYPIVAVSQGANLLAQAQGAWVDRGPQLKEIGWITAEIYPDYSRNSVVYGDLEETKFPAFCWYDTINGFPPKGYWYALSPNCRYQSTGINGNCYLFNFHPEVTEELIASWLKEYGKELGAPEAVKKIQEETSENIAFSKKLSHKIIHAFESFLKD